MQAWIPLPGWTRIGEFMEITNSVIDDITFSFSCYCNVVVHCFFIGYLKVNTYDSAMTVQYIRNEDGSVVDEVVIPSRF